MQQWEYCQVISLGTVETVFYTSEGSRKVRHKGEQGTTVIAWLGREGWEAYAVARDGSCFYLEQPLRDTEL